MKDKEKKDKERNTKDKESIRWLIFSVIFGIAIVLIFLPGLFRSKKLFEKSPLIGHEPPDFKAEKIKENENEGTGTESIEETKSIREISAESKIVFINFFASWCTECKEEREKLIELKKNNKEMKIVGVVFQDSKDKISNYLKEKNPYDYIYFDSGETAIDYGVSGVPETFLIIDGKIVKKFIGPISIYEATKIIGEKTTPP
jgi:cytochrome c biogenesis protein CcmG/thiol:disulfide interchange protein DsbE